MNSEWVTDHRTTVRWAAVLVPVAMAAVLALLRDDVGGSPAAMVLVLAVVAAAATGDRLAGLVAASSAAVSFDYFLTMPYYSLSIRERDDLELAAGLVIIGLAVTEIALWGRRQQATALRREGYLQGLGQLLDVPADASVEARAQVIATAITQVLGADRAEWVFDHPRWNDAVVDANGQVLSGGRIVPIQRLGLPTESCTAIPVRRAGLMLGHFQVVTSTHVVRPGAEQLRVAVLLAERMASVEAVEPLPDRSVEHVDEQAPHKLGASAGQPSQSEPPNDKA